MVISNQAQPRNISTELVMFYMGEENGNKLLLADVKLRNAEIAAINASYGNREGARNGSKWI